MLQAESLSANSAYSSSVMRVLTTRLRCGVLYRFRMVKPPFCAWCPLTNRRKTGCEAELFLKNPKKYFEGFLSGASRISRVWGRHSPTRFPQGQNERKANFGTAVESCSKKSTLRLGVLFAQFLLLCPTTDNLQFCQTERQTFFNAAHFRRNGRKKSSKPFSDLLLVCAAVMGGGYSVVSGGDTRLKRNLNNAFSSVSVMKSSASLSACPLIREA